MNPISQPAPQAAPLLHDILPPKETASQPAQTPVGTTVQPEFVNDIPVQNPLGTAEASRPVATANPIAQATKSIIRNVSGQDKELDQILKDVNNSVKQIDKPAEARFANLKGATSQPATVQPNTKSNKKTSAILATAVACVVAVVLSVSAIMIYKK
ncbi:MAG TPA: hypothetical protein VFB03_03995 [Candidatus Saccharimonadales bacterium]|nr:hypothetical protein [Candidatus Saccharimonadales bacterium]